jgi:hypothetical protein
LLAKERSWVVYHQLRSRAEGDERYVDEILRSPCTRGEVAGREEWRDEGRREGEKTHKLVNTLLNTLTSSINDITSVILGGLEQVLHETSETRQVGGDVWDTHDGTFCGGVSEGFVCKSVWSGVQRTKGRKGDNGVVIAFSWRLRVDR